VLALDFRIVAQRKSVHRGCRACGTSPLHLWWRRARDTPTFVEELVLRCSGTMQSSLRSSSFCRTDLGFGDFP